MATNAMTTATSGLSTGMVTLYNKNLLKTFEPLLAHLSFGDEHPFPKNNGKTQSFRKLIPLEADTTTLTEGEPGDPETIAEVEVLATLKQYGKYVKTTDLLDLTHFDLTIDRKVMMLGEQGRESIDAVVRDELANCTNVIYANGKTSRATLTATDKLTTRELRKAVRELKKNHAQTFADGCYVALVTPDVVYDLQDDENFIKVSAYQMKEGILMGEVGKLFGCRIVETTQAKVFEKAGASNADVASVIVLGQYAYGYTSLTGSNPRVIVKPAGSAGTGDPLDQVSTVGWKMDGFAVKLLQPEFAVRIECGFSA